ncbi:MAG: acyltransferase, partial [Pseudanabaena sp.]
IFICFKNILLRANRKILVKAYKQLCQGNSNYNLKSVNFKIEGEFLKHATTNIDEGSNIIVFKDGYLEIGKDCYVGRYVEIGTNAKIIIKDYTSIQDRCVILGDVTIGRYCLLSLNILISSGYHSYDVVPEWLIRDQDILITNKFNTNKKSSEETKVKVVIEDDCWLGINVVIMKGVTIHKGCIIGANSVVTKDLPPYSVAVGAPARVIKKRLDFVAKQKIHWNNISDLPYFYSGFLVSQKEIEEFKCHGGLIAENQFTICLKYQPSHKNLYIMVKSMSESKCCLKYSSQSISISTHMNQYMFAISEDQLDNFFSFNVSSNSTSSISVAVQSAWTV